MAQLMQKDEEQEEDVNRDAERIKGLGYSVYVSAFLKDLLPSAHLSDHRSTFILCDRVVLQS
jgi:hypothetical protein